jgi:hypothetical protein
LFLKSDILYNYTLLSPSLATVPRDTKDIIAVLVWSRTNRGCEAEASGLERPSVRRAPSTCPISKHPYVSGRYEAALRSFKSDTIREADVNSLLYVLPLVRLLLLEFFAEYETSLDPERHHEIIDHGLDDSLYQVRELHRSLTIINKNISVFGPLSYAQQRSSQRNNLTGLLRDMQLLLHDLEKAEEFYRRLQMDELHQAQLREAKESKDAAISVGRLTKLAFIFIPLNFTTSFFGTNMAAFGTGNMPLWVFFIVAVVVSFLTLLPILRIAMEATRDLLSGDKGLLLEVWPKPSPFAYTMKLTRYSPYIAFWFGMFCLFHTRWTIAGFCDGALNHYLKNGKKSRTTPFNRLYDRLWVFKDRKAVGMFATFWKRGKEILDFIDKPGWDEETFLDRLIIRLKPKRQERGSKVQTVSDSAVSRDHP